MSNLLGPSESSSNFQVVGRGLMKKMVVATRLKHIKLAISNWVKQILRIYAK